MLFDDQVEEFDARAGLPEGVAEAVARRVLKAAGLHTREALLEIGAGTGLIGKVLAGLPLTYLGLDSSLPMLRKFRQGMGQSAFPSLLLQADGNQCWPLGEGRVRAVFSSRALHHLDAEHVARELIRVGSDLGVLLMTGKVRRGEDAPKARMRRQMRRFMAEAGFQGRGGGSGEDPVLKCLAERGGERAAPLIVSRWRTPYAPRMSIEAWRRKSGLGGLELPGAVKEGVLARLAAWSAENMGDQDRVSEMEEYYELNGVKLAGPLMRMLK